MTARRVRRDGIAVWILFFAGPFGALAFGAFAHPLGILDSDPEIRGRVEGWRPTAALAAREAGVPLDLLLALVSAESSGRPRARSPSGAVGLTQVLTPTARGVAVQLGLPAPAESDLYDPPLNLRLGAAYLAEQLRAFGGDPALALAAYHSGPGKPAAWRRADPAADGLALVRAKGTPRTRLYVERVLDRRAWFAEDPAAAR